MMRFVVMVFGTLAVLGLMAISTVMNFRFGVSLGANEGDGLVLGAASACADVLKALLPFAVAAAWRHRRYLPGLAAGVLWLVFTGYSLTSALGFSAVNRSEVEATRGIAAGEVARAQAELKDMTGKLDALPGARLSSVIEAELQALKGSKAWLSSAGCTDATVAASKALCADVERLTGELGVSGKRAELEERRNAAKAAFEALASRPVSLDVDPQAGALAGLLGIEQSRVKLGLVVFVALLVELGSGLGLFALVQSGALQAPAGRPAAREVPALAKPVVVVEAVSEEVKEARHWLRERIERDVGANTSATALYQDFTAWAEREKLAEVMTLTAFGRWLTDQGFEKVKRDGRMHYLGVRLKGANVVALRKGGGG